MVNPSPSTLQKAAAFWVSGTGVNWPTYRTIFKNTVAPAIGLAANQATSWSTVFGMLGFLVPMVSIISCPSPPRAEFFWIWVTNVLGSCVSAAATALALFCVIKAREHTGSPVSNIDPDHVPYNAAASTVAAIWLIIQTYIISAVRYIYPRTTWMTSACLIFSNYGMVYAVQFADMTVAYRFLRQLLFAHLVGFGISAGVSLLLFPSNSREPFLSTASACAREVQLALRTNIQLMERTVEGAGFLVPLELNTARKQQKARLDTLQSKLAVQLGDAQNEVSFGMLAPVDLRAIKHWLEEIIIPLIGLCQVPDVMESALRYNESSEDDEKQAVEQYPELLGSVLKPFSRAAAAAGACLEHSARTIGLDNPTPSVEHARPDKETSAQQLQQAMEILVKSKADLLNAWNAQNGSLDGDPTFGDSLRDDHSHGKHEQCLGNLHILLYTELLLWSICHRTQELLLWTEELKTSQTLKKKRLITPEWASLKALASTFRQWAKLPSDDRSSLHIGRQRHRSSRLVAPRTTWTFILRLLHKSTRFFASPASGFAFRVTCATMSIAIAAYLPSSQGFYIKQHLVWGQYTVSFAMQGSAGQGVRALVFRMGGTVAAVCLAWISWYIVVGIPAGVLVFYWVSMHLPMYIMALYPRYSTVGTVAAFALTTILGNALQPGGSGQPTIILGAVRLAAIGGGCLLATIWTLFPFPVSDLDGARKSLGACLASLAEYHTGFHEIVQIRLGEGLTREKPTAEHRDLKDTHSQLLVNCNSHLQALRTQIRLAKWNILTDGALFSRSHYDTACQKIDDLTRNMQLITFASEVFLDFINTQPSTLSDSAFRGLVDFRNLFHAADNDGFGVAAMLGLLAHSVLHESSLPPKLNPPSPERLWKYFDEPERVAQQIRQIDAPGAATFALMRIGTKGLYKDLAELFETVKDMVGEFDLACKLAVDDEA